MPGYTMQKQQLQTRLRRIEGQVRGVARMIDEDKYCVDVVTQVAAIQAALDKVSLGLLDGHIRGCVREEIEAGGGEAKVDERLPDAPWLASIRSEMFDTAPRGHRPREERVMLGAVLLGLVAGVIARMLMPGDVFRNMSGPASWLVSIALGLAGAVVGYLIFTVGLGIGDTDMFDFGGIISAIIGTLIVLVVVGFFVRRRGTPGV